MNRSVSISFSGKATSTMLTEKVKESENGVEVEVEKPVSQTVPLMEKIKEVLASAGIVGGGTVSIEGDPAFTQTFTIEGGEEQAAAVAQGDGSGQ